MLSSYEKRAAIRSYGGCERRSFGLRKTFASSNAYGYRTTQRNKGSGIAISKGAADANFKFSFSYSRKCAYISSTSKSMSSERYLSAADGNKW